MDPNAGGSINFNFSVEPSSYDSATITIDGQDIGGTTWSGMLNGKVVSPGTYTATLTVTKEDETATASTPVIVVESADCKLKVTVGSSTNVASGELTDSLPLFSTLGTGPALSLSLHYGSLDGYRGPLGLGWSHSFEIFVTENAFGELVLHEGNGGRKLYTPSGSGYLSQPGDNSILHKNTNGTFTLTRKDGTRYDFRTDGKISSITDRNGNALNFAYAGGLLKSVTDTTGRSLTFNYAGDKLASVVDPAGQTYHFSVGESLNRVTFPGGGTWSYTYDENAFLTAQTDPNGALTTYRYDDRYRVVSSTDPEGRVRTISYPQSDQEVRTTTFTEKDGGVWRYTYDSAAGDLLAKTDPEGNVTSYTYDATHNQLSKTDVAGTTWYAYDGAGNMTLVTDVAGQTTSYTYNAFGQVTSITDPEGNVSTFEYDQRGNLRKTIDPTGRAAVYTYDARGNVTSVTDPAGRTTMTYDSAGNLATITDPAGATNRFEYDAAGRMSRQTDPQGNVATFAYDARGNLIKVIDPLGNTTTSTYDAKGHKTSETDANGNATRFEYNFQGQMLQMIDAEGFVTTFSYGGSAGCSSCSGGVDKMTAVTDANGNATHFRYDTLGRPIEETGPLGNPTRYAYDAKGNLTAKTDGNGHTIRYAYDSLGRLLTKNYPDGTSETFTYDARGNILTAANKDIGYLFTYDAAGRMTGMTDHTWATIGYEYDGAGRKTSMIAPDGEVIHYRYDPAGRLAAIRNGGDFLFGYDNLGRRTALTYPNGVTATYRYDAAGRLTSLTHKNAPGEIVAKSDYALDKIGNRLGKTTEQRRTDYGYDKIYRLREAVSSAPGFSFDTGNGKSGQGVARAVQNQKEHYLYDPVGNRRTSHLDRGYNHNAGNQLLATGQARYTYDRNGNLAQKESSAGITTYQWDYENRLTKVTMPDGTVAEYAYDPFGRRTEKKIADGSGVKTTRYLYDKEDILYETDETGAIQNRYLHGPGIDEPLALIQGRDTYYYHADGLGSITAITDNRGKVIQDYQYDSYGNLHDQKNRIKQSYTYTGREWDRETGLYYYRARYYDPMEGRFVSRDPIGFEGGDFNLYGYVQSNPINAIDPFGQMAARPGFSMLFVRPKEMPCNPWDYCKKKLEEKQKKCAFSTNAACLDNAKIWYQQCISWAMGVENDVNPNECIPCEE